jgi:hypothetical protein
LQGLVWNLRAAMILIDQAKRIIADYYTVAGTILRCSIDALLAEVAARYKAMNAMSDLSYDEVRERCADAFRAVHCPSAVISDEVAFKLVARCGMITDGRRLIDGTAKAQAEAEEEGDVVSRETSADGTVAFYRTPKEGRYAMSAAIGLMILSNFGTHPTNFSSGTSGGALEELVAAKIALAFALTSNLREALEALSIPTGDAPHCRLEGDVVKMRLTDRISQGNNDDGKHVWVPQEAESGIARIKLELVEGARAVVAINGRGAPHADIIVAVEGWLGLFRIKDVEPGTTTPFRDELINCHLLQDEQHKWPRDNVTARLQRITGTDGTIPDFVFVVSDHQTSEPVWPEGLEPRVHVRDSASAVLKPLLWPGKALNMSRTVMKGTKGYRPVPIDAATATV